jgi:hypothetical protein
MTCLSIVLMTAMGGQGAIVAQALAQLREATHPHPVPTWVASLTFGVGLEVTMHSARLLSHTECHRVQMFWKEVAIVFGYPPGAEAISHLAIKNHGSWVWPPLRAFFPQNL